MKHIPPQRVKKTKGINMAGHSKWANIQHKKARQDAKRGKNLHPSD